MKQLTSLVLSAVLFWSLDAAAQTTVGRVDAAAPAGAAQSATTLRLRGTIQQYDPATRTLSLATANGTVQLPLAATVRIGRDGHKLDAAELGNLSGYRAAVRYSESAGRKTVESVHVFGKEGRD